jgi:hypothetical protein
MGDDRDKSTEPEDKPPDDTVERSRQRIRRSRDLLGRIDELLGKRQSPPKDGD